MAKTEFAAGPFSIEVMIYHDHKGRKIASDREECRSQDHQCHPGQFLQFHILNHAVKDSWIIDGFALKKICP